MQLRKIVEQHNAEVTQKKSDDAMRNRRRERRYAKALRIEKKRATKKAIRKGRAVVDHDNAVEAHIKRLGLEPPKPA